ncbi:septum formation initiator family protein [bacterium]|nr:septum formation initiator family protein [bacterium]
MKRRWVNQIFFTVTACLFFYICGIGINNIFRYNAFRRELDEQERILLLENHANQLYKRQLSQLDTPGFWELQAKNRLGYVNPGEVVYKVIPDTSKRK